jgi:hypothetical protein
VTEKRNAKTKFPGEQDIGHKFFTAKEPRSKKNTTIDIRVDSWGIPGGGSIQSKYVVGTRECMHYLFDLIPASTDIICTG